MKTFRQAILWAGLAVPLLTAQQGAPPAAPQGGQAAAPQPDEAAEKVRPTYVLGPGDQIMIHAFEVEEISDKPFRIDSSGDVNLPVLETVHAGGMTVEQFEADLKQRLRTLVKEPQVSVNVIQFRSEPVFFAGAFVKPGMYTLQGRRTLVEMLTAVGGLLPTASRRVEVTRQPEYGRIPLPNAVVDPDTKVSSVDISMGSLTESMSPAEDIVLQPYDRITVEKAEMVYVDGQVAKVGGVELGERDSISITKLISMVGGISKDAAPEKAQILRPILNTSRRAKIPVNLKKILTGEQADFPLLPNDVLYVPRGHRIGPSQLGLIGLPIVTSLAYVLASKL